MRFCVFCSAALWMIVCGCVSVDRDAQRAVDALRLGNNAQAEAWSTELAEDSYYSKNLGVAPIQEIYSGAAKYKAEVAVVVTNSHFTSHAKKLASSLGVLLWDREELALLMKRKKRKVCDTERDSLPSYIVSE